MRHLLVFSVLLLGTLWAAAQTSPSHETAGGSGQATVQGCLSNSGGTYTLTEKDGKTVQLTGDTSKLTEHVGHEIKVTGTTSSASAASSDSMGKTSAGETIEVQSVKHISKKCEGKSSSY